MNQPSRKKILFVITKSNWGGAQRYVYDLATALPKDRFETKVILGGTGEAGANPGVLEIKLNEQGIPRVWIKEFMRDISFEQEWKVYDLLVEIFKKENPDAVHLNSSKAGGIGALAARRAGVKNIIFTVHGWPFLEDRSIFAKAIIWMASWVTALLCHKVICISEFDLKIAREMPFVRKKAFLIYNGIAPINFGSGYAVRKYFPTGVKITGTIGELNKNKNQIALIDQARKDPDLYVAIVGSGEDINMLTEKIKEYGLKDRVQLLGFVPASEALKGFDAFALPSIKEGLPYVLLEAKLAGLPIVANRVGGVGEILDAKDMSEFSLEQMVQKTIATYNS
ncbi:MAG: glycosyltransferase [Candidatus Kaiserbacteria bacterium]|nr:glycosyltransferase [Candidatus Kaiserbacteria bacterium]